MEVGEGDGEVAEKCGDRRSEGEDRGDDSGDGRASEAASDEEGGVPIQLPNPRTPTRQEREEHEATHLPYRSWCEHCVRGKGRRRGHRRRENEQKKADLGNVTKVYMDFYYNGSSANKDEEKEDKEKDGGIDSPAVVLYDGRTEALASWVMESKSFVKGGRNDWVPKMIASELEQWGYQNRKIILVSDGEPAILALKGRIIEERVAETVPEETPVGEHEANLAEGAVRRVREHTRVLISSLETKAKGELDRNGAVIQWAVRWAAMMLNCFKVGVDGMTAYQRIRGRKCRLPVAVFGECVLYKELRDGTAGRGKIDSDWNSGIWLGVRGRTGEHIIGTNEGVVKAWSVKRRPDEEKWDMAAVNAVKGTPARPKPGRDDPRIPIRIDLPRRIGSGVDQPPGFVPRRVYIKKRDYEEYGYTPGCEGCVRMQDGRGKRPHNQECVERMMEALKSSEEGRRRLQAADDRVNEELARRMEEEIRGGEAAKEPDDEKMEDVGVKRRIEGEEADAKRRRASAEEHGGSSGSHEGQAPADVIMRMRRRTGRKVMDLSDSDGWDFSRRDHREAVLEQLANCQPEVVMRSGTPAKRGGMIAEAGKEQAKDLATACFLARVYEIQADAGRTFVHEGKMLAKEWRTPGMLRLRRRAGVVVSVAAAGEIKVMTNSMGVTEQLAGRQCEHSRSRKLLAAGPGPVPIAPRHEEDGQEVAWDDASGAELDVEIVKEARRLEIEYVKGRNVYSKVRRSDVPKGGKVVKTKWVDINKGDLENMNVRSRLVAMEFKDGQDPELFAGTPPLEALRLLCSVAATIDEHQEEHMVMMINDVKRAYFYAEVEKPIWVELPAEDMTDEDVAEDRVGRLNVSMYGTRDAARNWQAKVTKHLHSIGFAKGVSNPGIFRHESRGVALLVHGDDYVSVGSLSALEWLEEEIAKQFDIKTTKIGPQEGLEKEVRVLNRIVRVGPLGWEYESDQRHGEIIVQETGMGSAKPVSTPGRDIAFEDDAEMPLPDGQARWYRGVAARGNYLSQDRADVAFACKEACRSMSAPRFVDLEKIRRLGKYLVGVPRVVQHFHWQSSDAELVVYTDADWAGCKRTRKSTSGGLVMRGSHSIKCWSKTQQTIALSSAEAELASLVKGSCEAIGIDALMKDLMGKSSKIMVRTDASAAIGIASREGVGRTRHLETGALWIQQKQWEDRISIQKVAGKDNPADVLTKHVPSDVLWRHMHAMGFQRLSGRARNAVEVVG